MTKKQEEPVGRYVAETGYVFGKPYKPGEVLGKRVRRWRCTGFAWFWGDDQDDFGSVIPYAGRYVATTVRGSAEFEILGDAKDFVEEHSS